MFKIYDGREHFYQWDSDRKLIVEDPAIKEVHFCNRTDDCSLVCETYTEDGLTLANVPNILLQTDWRIKVYAFDGNYTKYEECYEVKPRTKPADYVYTETDVVNYTNLLERMNTIDENIEETVGDYFENHPDVKGDKGDPGYTPVRGIDYWTETDKAEIVDDVLDAMPQAEEVEV